MSSNKINTIRKNSLVNPDNFKRKNISKNVQNKVNKFFRPWVTCHCVDCNLNIDSKKLVDIMKKALNPSIESNFEEEIVRNQRKHRNNSIDDSLDMQSQVSSDSTIIYQDSIP